MWPVGLWVAAVIAILVTRWIYKWRNPKCNGVLPPGSMGLPLLGETLDLIIPSNSIDIPPFIKKRVKRYGPIFKTSVAGRAVVVTADPEFNYYILQQQGKSVDTWSLDTFAKVFQQGQSTHDGTYIRKYVRSLTLNHFGVEALKEKLLPRMEQMVHQTLGSWSTQESTEVKSGAIAMTINFAARQLFSDDTENAPVKLSDLFSDFVDGLMSFPVNIPGTAHHRCLKNHQKVLDMMRDVVQKRRTSFERRHDDLLDHIIQDMSTETFITEDYIVQQMFGLLFVTSDSISTTLALAFKLLEEQPSVLEELIAEHEAILKNRENLDSPITWKEYKSMTFTIQVINEVLRLGNISPGLFRRALKDIQVNGYTIPSGWIILIATSALHLNSDKFEDPLSFNPSRWKVKLIR
ncbi:hypothetical protein F0562_022345 [Nyssa sinensis]|uniref:Cytochrome P450 n=1 Tax=Nyssa sinensis TaxID=561372 RepID=A0A5J5BMJ3_9ASTE|nr:hypothetical protein F0562_022345 [Nyssa sinensis]